MTVKNILKDTAGASAIEYGLLAALISVGIVVALTGTGRAVDNSITNVEACLGGDCSDRAAVAGSSAGTGSDSSSSGGDSRGTINTGTGLGRR